MPENFLAYTLLAARITLDRSDFVPRVLTAVASRLGHKSAMQPADCLG